MKIFATKEKERYYSSSIIDKTKATYRMIIGRRGNGKTYCICRKIVNAWFKRNLPSAYIRRWKEEIQNMNVQMLFAPHEEYIKKITKGKYNGVILKSGVYYVVKYDNDGNKIDTHKTPLCYLGCLSTWEKSKGQDRGQIAYFVFDEFLTRSNYLANEFAKFANCHSSFVRGRPGVITYMIANTVNTESIYWEEMGINKIDKQKPGEIYLYNYNNEKLTVAVEYCPPPDEQSKEMEYYYAFDNPALEMIKSGDWQTDMYPHLENFSVSKETMLRKFFVIFNDSIVTGEIHRSGNELFVFFHAFGNSKHIISEKDIVYTNHETTYITWFHRFNDVGLSPNLERVLKLIRYCFAHDKVFYSTNRIGEVIRNFLMNPFTSKGSK